MNNRRRISAKIVFNKQVAADHYLMEIEALDLAQSSRPGQFIMVKPQEKGYDPLFRIPLGIHTIREKGIKLLYKVVGPATRLLSEKAKGEKIDVLGPLGNGFNLYSNSRVIIIAGGHGIAPLYALAEEAAKKGYETVFFIGACTKGHVLCSNGLKKLGIKVYVATEDGSQGHKGYITDLLKNYLLRNTPQSAIRNPQSAIRNTIYACGPKPMLAVIAQTAAKNCIPSQVSLDEYMVCGIGACLGCAVRTVSGGYKLVCDDGPVFDANDIVWESTS